MGRSRRERQSRASGHLDIMWASRGMRVGDFWGVVGVVGVDGVESEDRSLKGIQVVRVVVCQKRRIVRVMRVIGRSRGRRLFVIFGGWWRGRMSVCFSGG